MSDKAKAEKKANKPTKQQKPIPKISPKKAARERELKKVRDKKKEEVRFCQNCGQTNELTYAHILPVKHYPQFEAHPDNGLILCMDCHHLLDNGTLQDRMGMRTWRQCVDVVMKLHPQYFNFLMRKK